VFARRPLVASPSLQTRTSGVAARVYSHSAGSYCLARTGLRYLHHPFRDESAADLRIMDLRESFVASVR